MRAEQSGEQYKLVNRDRGLSYAALARPARVHITRIPMRRPAITPRLLPIISPMPHPKVQTRAYAAERFARYSANDSALWMACCLPLGSEFPVHVAGVC